MVQRHLAHRFSHFGVGDAIHAERGVHDADAKGLGNMFAHRVMCERRIDSEALAGEGPRRQ